MDQEAMSVGLKIQRARELQKPPLTQKEAATLLGMEEKTYQSIELDRSKKRAKEVVPRLSVAWNIRPSWFWDGKPTNPYAPDAVPPVTDSRPPKPEGRIVSLAGTPMAKVKVAGTVSAGAGATNVDPGTGNIWVPERLAQIGGLGWEVDGESMMPFLEPGDVALFREHRNPKRGYIFLVKSEGAEFKVKKLDWLQGEWTLVSLNPSFGIEPLGRHELMGFLIGWYRYKGTRETLDSDPNGLRFD